MSTFFDEKILDLQQNYKNVLVSNNTDIFLQERIFEISQSMDDLESEKVY